MANDEALLRDLFVDLGAIKEKQSEINRRLGLIETSARDMPVLAHRLGEVEAELDGAANARFEWKQFVLQTVASAVIITVLYGIASLFGVELKF